jgi:hypothetical protein
MIIAPGSPIDRRWWPDGHSIAVHFVERVRVSEWDPSPPRWSPLAEMDYPPIQSATLRRHWHPSWKVHLSFYVDGRIGQELPQGYVMPGWIHGVELEQSHLCEVCRRHADTPQGRLCFTHMIDYLERLGL